MSDSNKPSFRIYANVKRAITPKVIRDDALWGATAVVPYFFLPTLVGANGWLGFAMAVGLTYGLGAMFNVNAWRSGAITLGLTHLCYTVFAGGIEKVMPHPIWRLEGGGINGLSDSPSMPLQPGASVTTTPDGYQIQTYRQLPEATVVQDGMADYYRGDTAQPAHNAAYEDRM